MADLVRGYLDLGFVRRGKLTVLERRLYSYPFSISRVFHLDTAPPSMASLVLQTVSGTLNAGDCLTGIIRADVESSAHIRTQGATVVHRAPEGMNTREALELVVADDAALEYLPEPRILFPDSHLVQVIKLVLGRQSIAIACDGFVTYDPLQRNRVFRAYQTEIKIQSSDGMLLAIDRADIEALPKAGGRRAKYTAFGTLTVATSIKTIQLRQLCTTIEAAEASVDGLYSSVSILPNDCGISLRLAAGDGQSLRRGIVFGWIASRHHFFGGLPGLHKPL